MTEETNHAPLENCPVHDEPAKWHCGHCGKPVCKSCKPIGLHYQVFHRECVAMARTKLEKEETEKKDFEAPSLGVKIVSWTLFGFGVALFGVSLFLLGLSLFSKTMPLRPFMSGTVPASLDDIPGSRTVLNWISVIAGLIGVGASIIGLGLFNCARAARYALLTFSWLEIVVALLGWLGVWLLGEGFWDIPIFAVFLIWYFTRKNVRRQFEKVL